MGGFFIVIKMVLSLIDDVLLVFKKTSSILVDDVAVGAAKSSGFGAEKEGKMIFKIASFAFLNKIILLPIIFAMDYFFPKVIVVALLLGGAFLAYEGVEKIIHYFMNDKEEEKEASNDIDKVKSAIIVDFILSIEIIIIAMSAFQHAEFTTKVITISIVSFVAVIAVYGLIWMLVKMDDLGFWIKEEYEHPYLHNIANFLINSLPYIIKGLAVVGTLAMLLVGGGIYIHNVELFHHLNEIISFGMISEIIIGAVVGFVALIVIKGIKRLFNA